MILFEKRWVPLAYVYNGLVNVRRAHGTLWKNGQVKNVHYIDPVKPWKLGAEDEKRDDVVIQWWWVTFRRLEEEMKKDAPKDLDMLNNLVAH